MFVYAVFCGIANEAPGKIIYLGAWLIVAVRLTREEDWRNWPRVVSRISDAISLAKRVYDRTKRIPHERDSQLEISVADCSRVVIMPNIQRSN